ncbi:MAG: hypothetical protein KJ725_00020 [Gammaproteobacteria bacterium]|nr:hypothetical protein [Gammaproteobacteria bacterium]
MAFLNWGVDKRSGFGVEQLIDFSPRQTKITLRRSIAVAAGRIREPEKRAAVLAENLVKPNDDLRDRPVGFIW